MATQEPSTDGRTARRYRTRQAIVDAAVGLIEDGDLAPTGARIAARAGISLRSISHHFEDRDALLVAVARHEIDRTLAATVRLPREGPLDARLDAFVAQRARVLESLSAVRRVSLRYEPLSEALRRCIGEAVGLGRAEVAAMFGAELRAADGELDEELLTAADAATSWDTWHRLRQSGLSCEESARVMRRTLAALLASGASAG